MRFNYFIFEIKPLPFNAHYGKIAGGAASVVVVEEDAKAALIRAKEHVVKHRWEIISTDIAFEIDDEKMATIKYPQDDLKFLFDNAKRLGISCVYNLGRGGQFFN